MSSSLENLTGISMENHLCALVKTIIIEDDSEILDPWASSKLPSAISSYDIWPRSGTGVIASSQIGIAKLKAMFREKVLRPKTIKIRDYQIAELNMSLCPELIRIRDRTENAPTTVPSRGAIAEITRDVIEDAYLAITSLVIQHADPPTTEDSVINSPRFTQADTQSVLASPTVQEAIIGLCAERQGQDVGFSILRSASLSLECNAISYWLEQIFYYAPALRRLKLAIASPWSTSLDAARVVPKLTDFELAHTTISARAIIAVLTCSKDTLTHIGLRQVTLQDGSTWRELLSFIASEYRVLDSFSLVILREAAAGSMAIDFRKLKKSDVPGKCRSGLSCIEMGPSNNRRVTKLSYSGLMASSVLEIVSRYGSKGIPNYKT